ncbi:MAG TPA: glycosyltransferase family 4 protein [Candidatus Saccharimonadales bacterium]|nr:glycosyltransferase family 4 protein [Candidatus Saccharimonadales bacterium]
MKIGLVCPYSLNKQGGVQEVVLALKDGLRKKGHDIRIITPKPRSNGSDSNGNATSGSHVEHADDIIYFGTSTDFRSVSRTTAQISSTGDTEEVDAMLKDEDFDILHFHEPWIPFLSRQLLQRSNSVNIATFHSKVPESLLPRSFVKVMTPYLRSVMKYLHVYTAVSDAGAEYVAGMTDAHISIVPNGIDLKKYSKVTPKKKFNEENPTVLFIGRLEGRKGVKYLLSAFRRFAQDNPHARLVIVGDGPERERLELLAEDLEIDNVTFMGHVSEERKLELLAEAELFCSPALFGESFGIVLLEAIATGTICIAGNNSGYVGVMRDMGALSLVNPEDTEEFARRMHAFTHQKDLRKLWGKWAAGYVKQFDYPLVVDQYEKLYKESLSAHGRNAK